MNMKETVSHLLTWKTQKLSMTNLFETVVKRFVYIHSAVFILELQYINQEFEIIIQ